MHAAVAARVEIKLRVPLVVQAFGVDNNESVTRCDGVHVGDARHLGRTARTSMQHHHDRCRLGRVVGRWHIEDVVSWRLRSGPRRGQRETCPFEEEAINDACGVHVERVELVAHRVVNPGLPSAGNADIGDARAPLATRVNGTGVTSGRNRRTGTAIGAAPKGYSFLRRQPRGAQAVLRPCPSRRIQLAVAAVNEQN